MFLLSDEAIRELLNESKPIPDGLRPFSKLVEHNKHARRDYEITCASGNFVCDRSKAINDEPL